MDSGTSSPIRVSRRIQEKAQRQVEFRQQQSVPLDAKSPKVQPYDAKAKVTAASPTSAAAPHDVIAFGGSAGGALLTLALPAIVYLVVISCDKSNGCTITKLPSCPGNWQAFFNLEVFGVVLAWYLFQMALAVLPLGSLVKGQRLSTGKQLDYRCNGLLALILTTILFAAAVQLDVPMDYVSKHWLQVVTANIVYSFILSVGLYIKALYVRSDELAPESTGHLLNDFFMGRELNPRIGSLDLKFFFELRPGLIGWIMIDWCMCASQYRVDGTVSPALALVTIFHTIYVFDALKNESAILTTMDITTEGFGFMLAFGDLAWVPSLYSLQAHFIYTYPQHAVSNPYALMAICALQAVGLIIFRGANSQKNQFRTDPKSPSVSHLATIPTSTGKHLLCSGFWGICRRPNYLGDLLMATAWSLTCGTQYLLPYFYPINFFILLVHRQIRDEAYCRHKYGAAWDKYCSVVPYRIIPYVF